MFRKIVFTLAGVVLSFLSFSQTEVDERAVIRFEKGLGFHAPDSAFGLNLRFRIQNRIGIENQLDNEVFADAVEARIRRLRLRIDGYTRSQRLTYYLQLSFSRDDQDWDNSKVPNIIRDAMIYYRFSEKFYFGFGQSKLPGNRQRIVSSGQLQFADRSLVNSEFNIDRDFGLMFYFSDALAGIEYNLKGAISSGEGRNSIKSDNGLAYTGRIEILPLGRFTNDGDFSEGDLEREPTPKLSIATGYSYNHKAVRKSGQRGTMLHEPRNIQSLFCDAVVKYHGWALSTEYIKRFVDDPFTYSDFQLPVYILTGIGLNSQASYFFKNNWEIAARHSWLEPDNKLTNFEPVRNEYSLGLTKYLNKHKIKAQLNLTYGKSGAFGESEPEREYVNAQFQVELGI